MQLLQTILRVNGATMVQVGDLWRIIPINGVSALPLAPVVNADPKTLPDDERMVLNLVFLKYTTAADMDKLLKPFYGEGATSSTYEPANLLIIEDNSRSMRRTMDLISMFDADTFAGKRVRLFEIENSRPSDLAKELETVFKAYSLSDKAGNVKFLPVDRINTLIAVAANPGIFADVEKWIDKLDIPVKMTAGTISNYVYRLKYGRAETVAMAIMALYSGDPMALVALAMMNNMASAGGMGGYGGGMGMGAYGGMGQFGGGMGMGGMNPYAAMGMGGGGYGIGAYGNYGGNMATPPITSAVGPVNQNTPPGGAGLTGSYLAQGMANGQRQQNGERVPHVIPNPLDNTLLVQAKPEEWEQISNLLRQLDVAPRQVLVDAKIYELDLTGAFASGVQAFLEKKDATGPFSRALNVASNGGVVLSTGALVLRSHQLLAAVSLAESNHHGRVIASPSIIATDSIPALMNVGQDVPVLTSSGTAITGSSFNSISSRTTGTTLSVMARVNASGIVTLMIDQDVSSPQGNTTSGINSPQFQTRHFTTQVTVQDGDTIAIGGFIQESKTLDETGIPIIHRIPILGAAFGSKNYSKSRTELVIFLTPRVIYDATQVNDATDEIKGRLKHIQKMIKNDPDKQ
jgi:general secretion pathway protein D